MSNLRLRLALTVRQTPVVSGFSYAFLRLLVDKAKVLKSSGNLHTTRPNTSTGRVYLTPEGSSVLNHICNQIERSATFSSNVQSELSDIEITIETASRFLSTFEPG